MLAIMCICLLIQIDHVLLIASLKINYFFCFNLVFALLKSQMPKAIFREERDREKNKASHVIGER